MTSDHSVTIWLGRLEEGDSQAAQQLWQRYYAQLVALARNKLGHAPRGMMDEDDAVQSAFDSFYRGVEKGRFPQLTDRGDLWQVLVMLTARKAINQRKHVGRQKRGGGKVRGESVLRDPDGANDERGLEQGGGAEPTPDFAAEVAEEFRGLLDRLDDHALRLIAFFKFEGRTNAEIATSLDCSVRAVERKLRLIRETLEQDGVD